MRITIAAILVLAGTCGLTWYKEKPAVSNQSAQPLEWSDVLDFMGVHAFKVRIDSEHPFNSMVVRLKWYERQGNGEFRSHALGEEMEVVELQKIRSRIVSVLWRNENGLIRFQVASPAQGRMEFTAPAQRLEHYEAVDRGGGGGMQVDGQTIIAVKWRASENGIVSKAPDKRLMQGYIAVEFELRDLKGVGD